MTIQINYIDGLGVTWDLAGGPVRLAPGAQGLGLLKVTAFTQTRGVRGGQRFAGWAVQPQGFTFPMRKSYPQYTDRSWADVDAAWWAGCTPDVQGLLQMIGPQGTRQVKVRTVDDGLTWDQSPDDIASEDFDWQLEADVPWWEGAPSYAAFAGGASAPFYGTSGFGPPFTISPANSIGSQLLTNPGQVAAFPVWTLSGPLTSFTITDALSGGVVAGSPNLQAGETLVIDETEDAKNATRYDVNGNASDFTASLTSVGFAPVPKGSSSNLTVALNGTGAAVAQLTPRYWKGY